VEDDAQKPEGELAQTEDEDDEEREAPACSNPLLPDEHGLDHGLHEDAARRF
jgi:hypothetical protein